MSARKTLFMETTQVPVIKTVSEIVCRLAAHKLVREVTQVYDAEGELAGVRFSVYEHGFIPCTYQLPVRVEPVFKVINGRRAYPRPHAAKDRDQAKRVAWRQVLRWVEAQMALIETEMVDPREVYLPYLLGSGGDGVERTVFEVFQRDHLALPPGSGEQRP